MGLSKGFGALQKVSEEEGILPGGMGIRPKAWGHSVGVGKGLWAPKGHRAWVILEGGGGLGRTRVGSPGSMLGLQVPPLSLKLPVLYLMTCTLV